MPNINDTYFDGYYKEIWRSLIPDELTVKEVDFMWLYFNLQPGNKVLDLMCCLLYTSPSPRDRTRSRMPSSA